MRNKQNPEVNTSPSIDIEQVNIEPLQKGAQTLNNSRDEKEENLLTPERKPLPTEEETMASPPTTEPIGIGSRLPTQDRQCLKDWWKPWEPTNTHNRDMSIEQDTVNSAHEPHVKLKNYAEALECCNMLVCSLQGRGVENQLVFEKRFTSKVFAWQ